MATNRKLREALLKDLGVSRQRLSQLAKKRKSELPMSTEQAHYTIAHENGIDIAKYLSPDETAEVRNLVAQLPRRSAGVPQANGGRSPSAATKRKPALVTIAGVNVEKIPGLSASHASEAKQMAEKVYPMIYVFENSVRDVVERVLSAAIGSDWWSKAVPPKVKKRAADHKASEKKEPWHGRRGAREIDYVYLSDLWLIIKHQWTHFKNLFPSQAWVESLITSDMNVSRRPIAHMNPLAADDVSNLEAAFRKWVKQLKAVSKDLP
jgi:hypothetical protein